MRRTRKAWMDPAALRAVASPEWWGIAFGCRESRVTEVCRVAITITYDDGRPAARRRKGKKGGCRG